MVTLSCMFQKHDSYKFSDISIPVWWKASTKDLSEKEDNVLSFFACKISFSELKRCEFCLFYRGNEISTIFKSTFFACLSDIFSGISVVIWIPKLFCDVIFTYWRHSLSFVFFVPCHIMIGLSAKETDFLIFSISSDCSFFTTSGVASCWAG